MFKKPTLTEVVRLADKLGIETVHAQDFYYNMEDLQWKRHGKPITHWQTEFRKLYCKHAKPYLNEEDY